MNLQQEILLSNYSTTLFCEFTTGNTFYQINDNATEKGIKINLKRIKCNMYEKKSKKIGLNILNESSLIKNIHVYSSIQGSKRVLDLLEEV